MVWLMKKRLEYIDASRGLAIFTVVYSHICLFCLPGYESSAVLEFLRSYFLNAFFFISGFVAFKQAFHPCKYYLDQLLNKVGLLLIPTVTVGVVYAISHNIPIILLLFDPAKYGYWFTFVLFEMFAIYYVVSIAFRLINKLRAVSMLMLLLAVGLYYAKKCGLYNVDISNLFCLDNLSYYFVYYSLGLFAKEYKALVTSVLYKWGGIVVAMIFIIVALSYVVPIPFFVKNMSILVIVLYVLRACCKQKETPEFMIPIKMILLTLGQYTLEIYFIHYFLLFNLPDALGEYLKELSASAKSLSFPEIIIVGCIVIAICYTCIVVAYFIKQIPFLSSLVFGKKIISNA